MRVDVSHDIPLAAQFLHRFDLCPHTGQSLLVRYGDSLENSTIVAIDWLWEPYKINMCEPALRQISYNNHSMSTDLDLRPWSECAGGDGRSSSYASGIERRLSWRNGEGRIESRGHRRSMSDTTSSAKKRMLPQGHRECKAGTSTLPTIASILVSVLKRRQGPDAL